LTLGHRGEEPSQGGTEITGGDIVAGKVIGDFPAGFFSREGLGFFTGVKGAEVRMGVAARSAALAAIGKRERTQRGTVFEAIGGHGISRKKDWILGFSGKSREGEA
jgi:hypothetical protein